MTIQPVPSFCLRSDTIRLPRAFHLHLQRPNFDPDFIANLVSRCNSRDVVEVILDTGCTFAITPDRRDFIEYYPSSSGSVETVNGPTINAGHGTVQWTLIGEDGELLDLTIPCHHIPASKVRLLSPQAFCQSKGFNPSQDHFGGNSTYFWMHSGHGNTRFQCPIEPNTNLPIALVKLPCKQSSCETRSSANHIPCSACSTCHSSIVSFSVADETNQNITAAQKELLLWHWRLGHLGFVHLQQIMRPRPTLESSGDAHQQNHPIPPCIIPRIDSTKTCKPPLCSSCEIARAKRRSCDSTVHHRLKEYVLKTDHLTPGTMVSVDQYESSVRGRLPDTRGQERFGVKYMGGTIFCDHASGYIQCFHQVSLRATDTVISKQKFERIAKGCGVQILSYHGDNGVFGSNEFRQALIESDQFLNFSGVGAHHQNGVAERAIRTVTEKARAMMQHVSTHWPDGFEISLWPFALHHACWLHNHTPSRSFGFSPIELFCQTKSACHHLQRARTWGSPTYVLDPKLQDGKKIPKWAPKARRGQFLGYSPDHSSSVGLIRNLQTGSISPQFHVVFDELFSTVLGTQDDDPVWIELFHNEREYYGPDDDEADDLQHFPDLDHGWLPAHEQRLDNTERLFQMPNMQTHTSADQDNSPSFTSQRNQEDTMPFEPSHPIAHNQDQDAQPDNEPPDNEPPDNEPPDISTPAEPPTVGTSSERRLRTRQPNSKFFGNDWVNSSSSSHQSGHLFPTPLSRTLVGIHQPNRLQEDQIFDNLDWDTRFHGEYTGLQDINDLHTDPATGEVEWQHPFSMGVKASNADTPTLREIHKLSPAEINAWYDSMDVEIAALRAKNTMIEINRSDVPADQQIIKSTWAFRRKRRPNGDIYKLKSRFVVRGDLQILTPTEQTYSPVVDWSTVRLLFILATAQHLHSITIDFTSAFVQSTLPAPIYLELPPGYSVPGEDRVFKVFKSLYGDIRAAKLWYQYLCDALVKKLGFHRSSIDPCLFIRHGLIFAFYVDDGIILSARQADSLAFVQELRQAGFDLGIEADYAGYLGVEIAPQADGTLLLSQSGLIQRILNDLSLTDATTVKATPAHEILSHHADSPPLDQSKFIYQSVLGKLLYLSSNTRPDISFANHQCARFSIHPKVPHGIALKRIGRYLLGTKDKGMIISPSKSLKLDCYADADFAGLFASSDPNDPKSVKSRSGFVITLAGIPVSWSSKLQSETALSTMESEYIALSQSLRVLLPLRLILKEVAAGLNLTPDSHSNICSTIYEDNQACLALATSDPPKMTPRSKSIAVKYHWFREHLIPGVIDVQAISSEDQAADIFTKPLLPVVFARARKLLLGW